MTGSGDSGDLAKADLAASTAWGSFLAQMRIRPRVVQEAPAVLSLLMKGVSACSTTALASSLSFTCE